MKIYAVKDTIVGTFMVPFYQHNEAEARRGFELAINSNGEIAKLYKDLQLFELGEFNEITGEIKSEVKFIANGAEMKRGE